ncbi:SERTA domain-containing protein 2-like isoform X2 [Littorina saxatilis]
MAYTPRKGVKRKYLEEEVDDISRCRQRQRIIDMSMSKLRTTTYRHGDPDPCLRRSVLILNTLKQIEAELKTEGVETHQSAEAAMNGIPEMSTSQLTLDPLPDMSTFMYPLPSISPIPMSVDAVPVEGGDYVTPDSSIVDLMPAKPLATCSQQALSQASPSMYFGAPSQGSDSVTTSSTMCFDMPSVTTQSPSAFFDSTAAVNSVLELLKMFGDGDSNNNSTAKGPYTNYIIDESTLDSLTITEADFSSMDQQLIPVHGSQTSDPSASSLLPSAMAAMRSHGTALLCSSSAGTASPSSIVQSSSTSIEDFAHYLQEASESACSSPLRSSQAAVMTNTQCSTYCRSDSTLDDLDSIMQILVGM